MTRRAGGTVEPSAVAHQVSHEFCVRSTESLIRIPSVTGEEKRLAEHLAEQLSGFGLEVESQEVSAGRFNVVGRLCGVDAGPAVMLAGHMDTVGPVAGWSSDPFVPRRDGDRLYGLGACDMKAGISAVLGALHAVCRCGGPLRGSVTVVMVVDEEAYSEGMTRFLSGGGRYDMAVMAEPHFSEAVLAAPGKVLVAGGVKGRAAHGASPGAGVNAIFEACRFLSSVEKLGGKHHPVLGSHPYCVLSIQGGYDRYCIVVPEQCRFVVNKHTVPGECPEEILRQLRSLKDELGIRGDLELEVRPPRYDWYVGDASKSPAPELAEAFRHVTGKDLVFGATSGVSDANLLWGSGIPTVSFGPSGGNLHAADEWVSVRELVLAARVCAYFIARVCGVRSNGESAQGSPAL